MLPLTDDDWCYIEMKIHFTMYTNRAALITFVNLVHFYYQSRIS